MKKAMKILPGNTFFERPTSIPGCDASGPGIVYPPRRKEAVFWNNSWKGFQPIMCGGCGLFI
jgi:hypothetical protein